MYSSKGHKVYPQIAVDFPAEMLKLFLHDSGSNLPREIWGEVEAITYLISLSYVPAPIDALIPAPAFPDFFNTQKLIYFETKGITAGTNSYGKVTKQLSKAFLQIYRMMSLTFPFSPFYGGISTYCMKDNTLIVMWLYLYETITG